MLHRFAEIGSPALETEKLERAVVGESPNEHRRVRCAAGLSAWAI